MFVHMCALYHEQNKKEMPEKIPLCEILMSSSSGGSIYSTHALIVYALDSAE